MIKKTLKVITAINAIVFLLSACAVDSDSYLPTVICVVSLAWIGLYMLSKEVNYYD